MKLFTCESCGQFLFFENRFCEKCGRHVGYLPDTGRIQALDPEQETYRFCANAEPDVCNWLVPAQSSEAFCIACRYNRAIPDLSDAANVERWRKIEIAKHRLFYGLLKLRLPLEGLLFDILADSPDGDRVMTGHNLGVITLALAEADDAERESRRLEMHEPYRTLLGHFRHEIGHYYWNILVRDSERLDACRALFGDDRETYDAALQRHYDEGPPKDWQEKFVSAYAAAHPWEDFAESWAHYLHIVDTLETARAFGVTVQPRLDHAGEISAAVDFDPFRADSIERLLDSWLPITFAVNNINRSLGQPDVYPFVLSPDAIKKLEFIRLLIQENQVK